MIEEYWPLMWTALIGAALVGSWLSTRRDHNRKPPEYRIEFYDGYGYLAEVWMDDGWRFIERDGRTTRPLTLWNDPIFHREFHDDLSGARTLVSAYKRNFNTAPLTVWTSDDFKGGW